MTKYDEAFTEGFDAYLAGEARDRCPHTDPHSDEFQGWLDGWEVASWEIKES